MYERRQRRSARMEIQGITKKYKSGGQHKHGNRIAPHTVRRNKVRVNKRVAYVSSHRICGSSFIYSLRWSGKDLAGEGGGGGGGCVFVRNIA